jgi:hypothetical protein
MITRNPRSRSGVTLTEILISILILGVGMVSLLTLFPLGLLRLRTAARLSRSTYLFESAGADLSARNLLTKFSFITPVLITPYQNTNGVVYDPWVQDTPAYGADWFNVQNPGAYRGVGGAGVLGKNYSASLGYVAGPGLPVAYDPLWRFAANVPVNSVLGEARFGSGIGFLRGTPSAHGLPRITNFFTPTSVVAIPETFVSPEDIVFQDPKSKYADLFGTGNGTSPSPLAPDLSNVSATAALSVPVPNTNNVATVYPPQNDWRFTWLFTGQQTDALAGTVFDGYVVVYENRQFGYDTVQSPFGGQIPKPADETVVEAVWGNGRIPPGNNRGYARAAKRNVLLRWPTTVADPDVKVGQWIADVTYERNQTVATTRFVNTGGLFPAQRCYWYQIVKRTEPGPDTALGANFRSMTVWVNSDLRAQSLLDNAGNPVNIEAALVAPSVVNVIPVTIYTR